MSSRGRRPRARRSGSSSRCSGSRLRAPGSSQSRGALHFGQEPGVWSLEPQLALLGPGRYDRLVGSSFTRSLGWFVAITGAILLLLYLFVFDTWEIPATDPLFVASVEPMLKPQDRILTSRHSTPKWGELARCMVPDGRGTYAIGRVFGT